MSESMRDVFLLGAGFSKAISQHMPLLAELGESIPFRAVNGRAAELVSENFEKALTFFAERQPWLDETENLRNRATFLEISRGVAWVLSRQQQQVLNEPLPEWLLRLVEKWGEAQVWVLTLNYDTLLEKAFTEHIRKSQNPHLGAIASHSSLYGVPIASVLSRTQAVLGGQAGEGFRLLKLHGSLNWRYSGSDSSPGDIIYDVGVTPGWNSDPLPEEAKLAAIDKYPLVIPPTFGKSSFFVNETIRSVWRLAHEALKKAERIYCLGYSFPESDNNMMSLLRNSIRQRATVVVVNPDAETSDRYERLLGLSFDVSRDFAGVSDPVQSFVEKYASP